MFEDIIGEDVKEVEKYYYHCSRCKHDFDDDNIGWIVCPMCGEICFINN